MWIPWQASNPEAAGFTPSSKGPCAARCPNPEAPPFTPPSREISASHSPNPQAPSFVPSTVSPVRLQTSVSTTREARPTVPVASNTTPIQTTTFQTSVPSLGPTPVSAPSTSSVEQATASAFPPWSSSMSSHVLALVPNPLTPTAQDIALFNSIHAVGRGIGRVEQAVNDIRVGQSGAKGANTASYADTVKVEDRILDLERAVIRVGADVKRIEERLDMAISSNRMTEVASNVIKTVVETVLARVDTMHDAEVARLQERVDRYSRSNHVLRDRLRFKAARAKENTRRDSSSSDFSTVVHRHNSAARRNSVVDVSDDSRTRSEVRESSPDSSALTLKVTNYADLVNESSALEDEANPHNIVDCSAYDFSFLDSVENLGESDKTYLRHFMASTQPDEVTMEVPQDTSSESEGGLSHHFSNTLCFRPSPPNIIKTGLDVSRGTLSPQTTPIKTRANTSEELPRVEPRVEAWNGDIRWAQDVFSPAELAEARMREEHFAGQYRGRGLPAMFTRGLRYKPSFNETNLRRAVALANLPSKITVTALLSQVRGGKIFSVSILDTASVIGVSSALVTFVHARSATMFVNMVAVSPLVYSGKCATVKLVSTPTWPISPGLEQGIFERGYSRVVVIVDFGNPVLQESLLKELKFFGFMRAMESAGAKGPDFVLRFTSIVAANTAYEFMASSPLYSDNDFCFGEDPCTEAKGRGEGGVQSAGGRVV